jgi:CzcA family heavy metal efflux pump
LTKAKYDVFPEFAPASVTIHTEAPGLSPEQVEILVTTPVENALNGVQGIETIRSTSIQGISEIVVTFKQGSNIYLARQLIGEQLASVTGELPSGVGTPVMTPLTSSTDVVLDLGLTSDTLSLMDLRTVADWTVTRTLLAVPGVSKVAAFGGYVKQLQIQVHPEKLLKYKLSINDIIAASQLATGIKGAGFVDNENQQILLQTAGQPVTPDQLSETVLLQNNGSNIRLKDVADVRYGPEPPIGAATIMGKQGILVEVSAQYGANTVDVTRRVEKAVDDLSVTLTKQGIKLYPSLFRPADFILTAISNVRSSLILGGILVIGLVFLFLFNLRTAAISCLAIPISLLAAITVLVNLGYSLNTMTLGGLAIAIGEVVDDAVIDVENIFRRLRENKYLENPHPVAKVIFDASLEVRGSVIYATFAVILVFIPVLTISGVTGRIFAPLGIAYIFAILASLIVALTLTPALCLLLLDPKDFPQSDPPVSRWLKERYKRTIVRVERLPNIVTGIVIVLIVLVIITIPFLTGSFLPELKEGNFIVHLTMTPGTSLKEMIRTGKLASQELLRLPFVNTVDNRIGRAEQGEETRGPNAGELGVGLIAGKQPADAQNSVRDVMSNFPGITTSVKTFLSERIEETISGFTASMIINIFGDDLDTITKKAQEIAAILSQIRGAIDIQVQSPPGTPQFNIELDQAAAARWGFKSADIIDAISTAYQGDVINQIYEQDRVFDVSVIVDSCSRRTIDDIGSLPLRNPQGTFIYLHQLARIYETSGLSSVIHEGSRRVQVVTCNVSGRSYSSFASDLENQVSSKVNLPPGTFIEYAGTAQAQAQSRNELLLYSLIAATGILIFLSVITGNYRNLLLIILNLPFALVGGLLVVLIGSGGKLSIGEMVGFVTLFGITIRNSIMLISHYRHIVRNENMDWRPDTMLKGSLERLVPILMTASVTAFGLLPLAIESGTPGREIEGPMALVILGGLVTSTLLNLFVLPTLALKFGRFEKKSAIAEF